MTDSKKRGGKMSSNALVEEVAVWLEINKQPAVSWMCTPERLEELAVGWLHGEGYISSMDDIVDLRPCATDPGFWVDIAPDRVEAVDREERQRVLASGCGAVTTLLGNPSLIRFEERAGSLPSMDDFRALFKRLFQTGSRYKDTGGIHAACLVKDGEILTSAEDIGRHNAVDKVIGHALIERSDLKATGLLVTGRISAELAFKAARAGLVYVATPSIPSNLAADVANRSGMTLVGRAVSGAPQFHFPKRDSKGT
jgi:FdhD protein